MTGVGSDASKLYVAGAGYPDPIMGVESYSWTGTIDADPYITNMQGVGSTYDIGKMGADIWVACGVNADSPVKAYGTAGAMLDIIPGALVEGAAFGLDFDEQGFLWVSNLLNDTIYKIDLSQGTGDSHGEAVVSLSCGSNPFHGSVSITGAGFAQGARIEVFDCTGRIVFSAPFQSGVSWGGTSPSGTYFARVSDGSNSSTLRLVKL